MKLATLVIGGGVLALATAAQGVAIRNLTTNTQLFYDDFEDTSVTPSTAVAYDGTVDADPVAASGAWGIFEGGGQGMFQVTASTSAPDPVPFQGSRALRVYRSTSHTEQDLQARFDLPETTPGDLIHLEMMAYFPAITNNNARAQFILAGPTLADGNGYSTARAWVYNSIDGFVHTVGPGESDVLTAVPYLTNVWQLWTLDYAIGASTFNFSVAGVSGSGASATSGDVYGAELFNGNTSPAGSFYLDIPEPASAAALALSAPCLLRRRRAV